MHTMKEQRTVIVDYEPTPFKHQARHFFRKLPRFFKNYFISIFPIFQWIFRYNLTWLVQDIIAGITVGIVIVPQSMAYAKIANLDPQYGLYTSFVGVTLYCFFGTSKDISIGPISTVSLLVGYVVNSVVKTNATITPSEVAVSIGLIAGITSTTISVLRLGILVDFIPEPAIAGYMTGSAITIVLSQCPKMFGISGISTHNAPYLVFVHILEKLNDTKIDVAFGLTSLVFLYAVRYSCNRFNCKSPILQKSIFLFGIMRNGLIVIAGTFISFLVTRGKSQSPISIIESVPAGFNAMAMPSLRVDFLQEAGGVLPSIVLIMVLEHISVAKAFGRIYNYQINADQEILAIGVCNVIGSFFGGYPATGAFSRTAIMARSGSRTPMAGVFSGLVVVLALYALTPAFYYIPDAVLAAVVIHAVSDLASGKKYLEELWHTSTIEFLVWVSAVLITIFVNIQTGIYAAVGMSLAIMLLRLARPPIKNLARINVQEKQPFLDSNDYKTIGFSGEKDTPYLYVDELDSNFLGKTTPLPTGILVLRLCSSILYPNAEYVSDAIVYSVKSKTRCGNIDEMNKSDSDKSWSQKPQSEGIAVMQLPVLEAIVFDFSAVCQLDATALDTLVTTRQTVARYTGNPVEWHFTGLQNEFVRSGLLHAGFGTLEEIEDCCASVFSENSLVSLSSANNHQILATVKLPKEATSEDSRQEHTIVNKKSDAQSSQNFIYDLEAISEIEQKHLECVMVCKTSFSTLAVPIDKYPCFHWDVDTAVRSICKRWSDFQTPL